MFGPLEREWKAAEADKWRAAPTGCSGFGPSRPSGGDWSCCKCIADDGPEPATEDGDVCWLWGTSERWWKPDNDVLGDPGLGRLGCGVELLLQGARAFEDSHLMVEGDMHDDWFDVAGWCNRAGDRRRTVESNDCSVPSVAALLLLLLVLQDKVGAEQGQ